MLRAKHNSDSFSVVLSASALREKNFDSRQLFWTHCSALLNPIELHFKTFHKSFYLRSE